MEGQRPPGIGRIATKYGVIHGLISFVIFLVGALSGLQQSWLLSVLNIAVLVVLMVLAHRELKAAQEGMMRYSQGLGSGTLLAVVSSIVVCVLVFIYVKYINTGYFAAAMKAQQAALEQRGITGAQAQQAMAVTSLIMTPGGIVVTSLIAGVITGTVVALIVSIFTQKSDPRAVI
ncbi:MAG TPA: DUF4199 domain-containing protein [Steroidobacteraceae bacterium]|nr:DUF4199 domain-containing protein [Steroidobacteraceae bacterium]